MMWDLVLTLYVVLSLIFLVYTFGEFIAQKWYAYIHFKKTERYRSELQ